MVKIRPKDTEENPISDIFDALYLLCHVSWRSEAILYTHDAEKPYIKINTDFGYYGDSRYYNITSELAQKLKNLYFVQGSPKMGYTDDNECRVTDIGRKEFFKILEEKKKIKTI